MSNRHDAKSITIAAVSNRKTVDENATSDFPVGQASVNI